MTNSRTGAGVACGTVEIHLTWNSIQLIWNFRAPAKAVAFIAFIIRNIELNNKNTPPGRPDSAVCALFNPAIEAYDAGFNASR